MARKNQSLAEAHCSRAAVKKMLAQRKPLSIAAIFFGGMIAGSILLGVFQYRPQPDPDTSTLKQTLQATAQETMKIPALSEANLQITIAKSQVDREVNRIKNLASKFGGAAIQGAVEADRTEVLAQIPPHLKERFFETVRDPGKEPGTNLALDASETVLVDVTLKFEP